MREEEKIILYNNFQYKICICFYIDTARDRLLQILRATSTPSLHYLFILVLSIKGTLLLALLARDRRSIAFLWICTPLAFATDKCSNGIAVLASRWFSIGLNILLTFFTYGACVTLSVDTIKAVHLFIPLQTNFYESRSSYFCTYIVCWNSDLQYVHFTTGKAPLHSYE